MFGRCANDCLTKTLATVKLQPAKTGDSAGLSRRSRCGEGGTKTVNFSANVASDDPNLRAGIG
jgi:hypothetical protein